MSVKMKGNGGVQEESKLLTGTVARDFYSWISFPQAPENTRRDVSNFFVIRGDIRNSRCTTGVVDNTSGKWKKSFIRKVLIILFGHLWGSGVNN
jgi:hypothetical protein